MSKKLRYGTYVKICGLTNPDDAALVTRYGPTHVGCLMVQDSPRGIEPSQAKEVFAAAGRGITPVLVFKSEKPEAVKAISKEVGTKHVQLHAYAEVDAEALESAGLIVYRVFDVPAGSNMLPPIIPQPTAKRPALLDVSGGTTGITFPWEILGSDAPLGTFISGGVRPENVSALLTHRPWGIAVSAGIEIKPGLKDKDRVQLLFETLEAGL